MRLWVAVLVVGWLSLVCGSALRADDFDDLARDFWAWRTVHQPLSGDDIPRLERPAGWKPDWSPASVAQQRKDLVAFEERCKRIDASGWPIPRQVDYRLIGSAIARVRWELEILRGWQGNPRFYIDQSLGAIYFSLLPPPPFDRARSEQVVNWMASIPETLEAGKANLTDAREPFARAALNNLRDVRERLTTTTRELKPLLDADAARLLSPLTEKAIVALESFRDWIEERLPSMSAETAVGREGYEFFLQRVALLPYSPEELIAMGRQEFDRSIAFEALETQHNLSLPPQTPAADLAELMERGQRGEQAVREFLEAKNILTVPEWVQHYRHRPVPPYLAPLTFLGVADDLTSATRLKDEGITYVRPPSPQSGYFGLANARDTRPLTAHEGVPGHYFQLALSWAHENPIRRYFYDSGPNEGIAFYAEEMLLQAGLFDDNPRTREIIYNFVRLRALRVEVDVRLALGEITIDQAAEILRTQVPMDPRTARGEAVFFAAGPGQAITYQIGKLQIIKFLADARRAQGEKFDLRTFHDFVWKNGNVPLSLQRWEYLGLADEIKLIDTM